MVKNTYHLDDLLVLLFPIVHGWNLRTTRKNSDAKLNANNHIYSHEAII